MLKIPGVVNVSRIRLHYRAVNQQAKFTTLEQPAQQGSFTVPGDAISSRWDLLYYFEITTPGGGGWFHPDPRTATPYYIVKVIP